MSRGELFEGEARWLIKKGQGAQGVWTCGKEKLQETDSASTIDAREEGMKGC